MNQVIYISFPTVDPKQLLKVLKPPSGMDSLLNSLQILSPRSFIHAFFTPLSILSKISCYIFLVLAPTTTKPMRGYLFNKQNEGANLKLTVEYDDHHRHQCHIVKRMGNVLGLGDWPGQRVHTSVAIQRGSKKEDKQAASPLTRGLPKIQADAAVQCAEQSWNAETKKYEPARASSPPPGRIPCLINQVVRQHMSYDRSLAGNNISNAVNANSLKRNPCYRPAATSSHADDTSTWPTPISSPVSSITPLKSSCDSGRSLDFNNAAARKGMLLLTSSSEEDATSPYFCITHAIWRLIASPHFL
ncbi:unnamed protein product [Dibothriocephalus latus]|uniref:Uncharacterized protein n=1 Tax=Dibothriocephalus latus TaxID=60516 RepID=A0A3P7LJF9_DIBLA|nr:unnamed protein product [Dibothriocephalus latus]